MGQDPLFAPHPPKHFLTIFDVLENTQQIDKIHQYTAEWLHDAEGRIDNKIEELIWMNILLYGVGGWDPKHKKFKADFFL
jgi:hypothetical protein